MHAMILAAGRGERLRPITDKTPKPLLKISGKPLIVYHLEKLSQAGVQEVVINICYLGTQIKKTLGNGSVWDLNIHYSHESDLLEVGGGICHALDLLGEHPFMVINGDIFTDFSFSSLPKTLGNAHLGHLVLVPNPKQHPQGDFGLHNMQIIKKIDQTSYTYSGIAILHPKLFIHSTSGAMPLAPFLHTAIQQKKLTGELYSGFWADVGTRDRLHSLQKR